MLIVIKLHFGVSFSEKVSGVFFPNINGFETQIITLSQKFKGGKAQII